MFENGIVNERIAAAFSKGKAFIGFVTAGDPSIEATERFVLEMARAGADLVELGIPFSDPIAEGQVIQEANIRALAAGSTVERIFALVQRLRSQIDIPLVFLTYFNPVFRYGSERFFCRCRQTGVDGIIIPDLPFEEQSEVRKAARTQHIALISLVAPTSEKRIQAIAREADGFLYIVSSLGVTGIRREIKTDLKSILETARAYTQIPCAVGFGINTPEQATAIAGFADGVIVGSALVKIVATYSTNAAQPLYEYVCTMKAALRQ